MQTLVQVLANKYAQPSIFSALPVFSPVSLNVSPNRQQFFTRESVSLTCEGEESSDGWTLKRISVVKTEKCGAARGFGRRNGSSCIVSDLSPLSDRGVYWCEHRSGQRSIKVTITVSGRRSILVPDFLIPCCKSTGPISSFLVGFRNGDMLFKC